MPYIAVGTAVAMAVAALAWYRSTRSGGFYDAHVYGMSPAAHRTYAGVSLGFAVSFVTFAVLRQETAGIAALGLFCVVAVFYGTSFLQGARDHDE